MINTMLVLWKRAVEMREKSSGYKKFHEKRLKASTNILEENCRLYKTSRVLEVGSTFPFITLPLAKKHGFTPVCADIQKVKDSSVSFVQLDLCKDAIPQKWDLILCTEVLEHLPCNLFDVVNKIISATRDDGHIFFTVPIGFVGTGLPLNKVFESGGDGKTHLREFTPWKAHEFFSSFGLLVVKEKLIYNTYFLHWSVLLRNS
jgi:hypothetical protein